MEPRTPVRQGFDAVLLLSRRDASRMQIHATGIVRFDFTAVLSVVIRRKSSSNLDGFGIGGRRFEIKSIERRIAGLVAV